MENNYLDLVSQDEPAEPPRQGDLPLPKELLRIILELAAGIDYPTERRLLLVSRWVREWILRVVYRATILAGNSRKFLQRVCAKMERRGPLFVKQYMTHFAATCRSYDGVTAALALAPHAQSLALTHRLASGRVLPTLKEFELLDDSLPSTPPFTLDLAQPSLVALTHLRIGNLHAYFKQQLLDARALPALTHLAFAYHRDVNGREHCSEILTVRPALLLLAACITQGDEVVSEEAFASVKDKRFCCVLVDFFWSNERLQGWSERARSGVGFWEQAELITRRPQQS